MNGCCLATQVQAVPDDMFYHENSYMNFCSHGIQECHKSRWLKHGSRDGLSPMAGTCKPSTPEVEADRSLELSDQPAEPNLGVSGSVTDL